MINHKQRYKNQIIPKRYKIIDAEFTLQRNDSRIRIPQTQNNNEPQFKQQQRIQEYRNSTLPDIYKNKSTEQIEMFQELSQICQFHQLSTISAALEECSYNKIKAFTKLIDHKPDHKKESKQEDKKLNEANRFHQKDNLPKLHRQFQHMSMKNLYLVNKFYEGDYHRCKDFLQEYYFEKKKNQIPKVKKTVHQFHEQPHSLDKKWQTSEHSNYQSQQWESTISMIRNQIDWHFKQKKRLQAFKKDKDNHKSRAELDRMIKQQILLINKLSQEARHAQIKRMVVTNCFSIDLHGYREQEVQPLFNMIKGIIIEQYQKGNINIPSNKLNSRKTVCITAVTGKGQHSVDQKSVLKQTLRYWCQDQEFTFNEYADHLKIYVGVDG